VGHDTLVALLTARWWRNRRFWRATAASSPPGMMPNWTRPAPARRGARGHRRMQAEYVETDRHRQPEDQAQQRAGLLHRDDDTHEDRMRAMP
jgi:hypothetical protein